LRIPIHGIDLVITATVTALMVMPSFYHLAADLRTRPTRNFSLIPHKKRHLAAGLLRLGLVGGAGVLTTSIGNFNASAGIWASLVFLLLLWNLAGATDRRLTIDAETGLVWWRKISFPWWPTVDGNSSFVDIAPRVSDNSSKQKMNLLGVATLERCWSTSYNGAVSSSGHYSDRTLAWVAEQVNDYLTAFEGHDTSAAREIRGRYRQQVDTARAPDRQRRADRAEAATRAAADKESRKAAKRAAKAARKEQSRVRRVEEKFQQ
jgi:hypothetical protein